MFRFKQFTIQHDRCAMKVGTDGVLLGAWSDVAQTSRILDVGTGTGLVALMIAQRSQARIVALEMDKDAISQAEENIENSPWKDRIEVIEQDFTTFVSEEKFDLIVSNPPYFVDSLECPGKQRTMARHNNSLRYDELLEGVARLLTDGGRFCVIIPTDVSESLKTQAAVLGLFVHKQLSVITTPGKPPKRTLIEFVPDPEVTCDRKELLLEIERHQYSPEYIALTQDFYLNM
ncbi:tRNA1(Val) (adenine(37)-N6)-methyltransferase [Bacteroides sp. 51]|uniref:tRNA1(Val) (adenine(37)-N6)-methyltransferase n=1 Tax=Bacteroides sp. 51 TaxID=2302938 RepID=UPI0013D20A85|nr:methyltransferase [Bacteroides sp. 51]NDV82632.1 methyltransferase domain-containing protein [Bacteroides sp. 51]